MVTAVLKNGLIYPKSPLPVEWTEGAEVRVERADADHEVATDDSLEKWIAKVEASVAESDPEDELILEKAVNDIRQQAREMARREAEKRA